MKVLILIALLTGPLALAGNRVGNGGDVVFCEKANSWEILDFHEARLNSVEITASGKSDPWVIMGERLKTIKQLAPKLYAQYSRRLKTMKSDIEFRDNVELTDVEDSLHAAVKKGCRVQQAALRVGFPKYNKDKPFVISNDLWKKLSANEQAGLLMHELIYEHFYKLGVKDSRPVRQFVSLVFSEKMNNMNKQMFWAQINEWGVPVYP